MLFIQAMENRNVRIQNLKALVKESGSIVAVAKACDTDAAYLSQLLNGTPLPSGAERSIGHKLARKLEEGCIKPVGWLDQPHGDTKNEPITPHSGISSESLRAARSLDALPEVVRRQVRLLLATLETEQYRDSPHKKGTHKLKRIELKAEAEVKSNVRDRDRR